MGEGRRHKLERGEGEGRGQKVEKGKGGGRKFNRIVAFSLVLQWFGGPRVLNNKKFNKTVSLNFFCSTARFC